MKKIKTALLPLHIIALTMICILLYSIPVMAGWVVLQENDPAIRDYMSVFFTGEKTGWVVGSASFEDYENPGLIGFTLDGGKTWNRSELRLESDLTDLYFLDEEHGWAVGQNGLIANTTNGKDWDLQVSKVPGVALTNTYFINEKIGFAVGENETILSTRNGGRQWKVLKGGQPGSGIGDDDTSMFNSVQFLDEKTGYIVGIRVLPVAKKQQSVIMKTEDGAQTWTSQETGQEDILEDIYMLNKNVGWAVGENGIVLHTKNGGAMWERQESGTEETLRSVSFVSEKVGFAVGGELGVGVIITTVDGGKTWVVEGTRQKMMKVQALNNKHVWLAGSTGLIMKSE
ncbi:hypothetical protein JT359_15065 [Candidatus Poribacteria bacterium]|nr:hypothetical protein [Candidatus Poribacteria bacterium]